MNKEEIKLKLVKIFTEQRYQQADINDEFIAKYMKLFWDGVFVRVAEAIKSGKESIRLEKYLISPLPLKIPPHDEARVWNEMFPRIMNELSNNKIPFTHEDRSYGPQAVILLSDLRKYSNVESLAVLK